MGRLIINGNSVYEIDDTSLPEDKQKQRKKTQKQKNNMLSIYRRNRNKES